MSGRETVELLRNEVGFDGPVLFIVDSAGGFNSAATGASAPPTSRTGEYVGASNPRRFAVAAPPSTLSHA